MRAAATVVLASPGGEFVVVRPGEEFPEWAEVTNPHAIAEGDDEAVGEALAGFAVLIVFAYAFSWVMAFVGLLVPSPEVVNNASFIVIFPLTFIANTFVPSENMPSILRTFAGWNPVSTLTHAARENFGNLGAMARNGMPEAAVRSQAEYTWALQNAEIYTLVWVLIILVIFVPLSTREYQRAMTK